MQLPSPKGFRVLDLPASPITGIHHLTAVTSHAQRAVDFYTSVLGLRLPTQTVDVDDPTSYHLHFGDEEHGPGMLSLLERKHSPGGQWGIGGTHHLAYETADRDTLRQWKRWLSDRGLPVTGPYNRVYFESIYFSDPDGLIIEIATRGPGWTVDEAGDALGRETKLPPPETMAGGRDEAAIAADTWPDSIPALTPTMRLGRMHHITAIGSDAGQIERLYSDVLGMRLVKRTVNFDNPSSPHLYFGVGDGPPGTIVTYFVYPRGTMRPARPGAGMTRHFALSVADDAALAEWRDYLNGVGMGTSGIRDGALFRSIELHDPDGLALHIATEVPLITSDEPNGRLGQRLRLPLRLEADRKEIEQRLLPLTVPEPIGR
jgi:glyoxalase family protein